MKFTDIVGIVLVLSTGYVLIMVIQTLTRAIRHMHRASELQSRLAVHNGQLMRTICHHCLDMHELPDSLNAEWIALNQEVIDLHGHSHEGEHNHNHHHHAH